MVDFGPALALAAVGAIVGLRSCRQDSHRARALAFFTLWAAVVLAFHQSVPARNVWYVYPAYPALALLAGGGLSEILGALRSRSPVLALTMGILAGACLMFGLERTWSEIRAPVQQSDPQRVANYLKGLDWPAVCQTAGSNLEA